MSKRNEDNDEIDSCVFVGTPLVDLLPEDAKFSVKPKRPEEQIVTDEKGRQRFHGAFTGGFSAGYFNTVGTKEGWAPATFKSSRSDKAGSKTTYRPEDFMDEEDFNEHGIAPRGLQIKSDYKDQFNQKDTYLAPRHKKSEFILESLIRPVESTIGVKMLRKMGWREGQGIGPKIKRKLRKLKSKANFEPGRRIYGVALPPDSESDQEGEDE
ncbi:G patch domain-containing 1 isoform X1, partial [Brachionus plicatilis]